MSICVGNFVDPIEFSGDGHTGWPSHDMGFTCYGEAQAKSPLTLILVNLTGPGLTEKDGPARRVMANCLCDRPFYRPTRRDKLRGFSRLSLNVGTKVFISTFKSDR